MRLGNIIEITDHLILPFGRATKSDLQKITLAAVAANGIYLRADIPCVYINVADKKPLRLLDVFDVFERPLNLPTDVTAMLDFMHEIVAQHMPSGTTTYEPSFLRHYFQFIKDRSVEQPLVRFNALLPIPQMQVYVEDVLDAISASAGAANSIACRYATECTFHESPLIGFARQAMMLRFDCVLARSFRHRAAKAGSRE